LDNEYFERVLDEAEEDWNRNELPSLGSETDRLIDRVIHGVQGHGKGIAGVLVCQLCIADIEPNLNTRLHKGGRRGIFYQRWQDGISLRSIDENYIKPPLIRRNLLVGNASGGSTMTRMLSTNLPYSKVTFEGHIKGPTSEWLELVDMIENPDGSINTNKALIRALGILCDIRSREDSVYEECISNIEDISEDRASEVIVESVRDSDMRSELLELASYSAFLADYDEKRNYSLERMTEHRAADAKSGRLGDIEIYLNDEIEELWDAKFERELTCREWEKLKIYLQTLVRV
jgi:hypothetical protein